MTREEQLVEMFILQATVYHELAAMVSGDRHVGPFKSCTEQTCIATKKRMDILQVDYKNGK